MGFDLKMVRDTAWRRSRMQALLGLTLLLAAVFGLGAWRTVRTERYKVSLATCMFAADASRVLQARAINYLETVSEPVFAAVGGRTPTAVGAPLPGPEAMRDADTLLARCHCAPRLTALRYFRLDLDPKGRVVALHMVSAPAKHATESDQPESVNVDGADVDSAHLEQAIVHVLPELREGGTLAAAVTHSDADYDTLRAIAVVSPKVDVNGHLRAAYGILVPPPKFTDEVLVHTFDRVPVFPPGMGALVSRTHTWVCCHETYGSNREVANLAVTDVKGTGLYQSGPIADTAMSAPGCVGIPMPDPRLALLRVELSPPLEIFDRWTDASTEIAHVPFLMAIMVGMLISTGAAALAARREGELARLRSDFVTSISHELRMPLAQILLSGETLSLGRTRTQTERDEAADAIVREAHRLTGLVDNALFFSRIEHHNLDISLRPVAVSELVADTMAAISPLAYGEGASIVNAIPPGLCALLDRDAFRQVLYNLVENAVKYGPPGQRVVIGGEVSAADHKRVRVWVDDQGSGVPADKAAAIFKPFVRLDRDRNRGIAGSGLGLAVVRQLVEQHGGRIWVERAREGVGSRFVMDLPGDSGCPEPATPSDRPGE